jgi:hypothetical protein
MSAGVADLGFEEDVPKPLPLRSDISAKALRPEDWFLFSRVDGKTNLRDLFRWSAGIDRRWPRCGASTRRGS